MIVTPSKAITMSTVKHIDVVPYNPAWPHLFKAEAQLIQHALETNCVAIHHVGSTAVPGLAAKPKIDILAVVKDPHLSIHPLEKAGYAYKGEWNIPFKYGFTKRGSLNVNLHLYKEGHPEIDLNLLFRDYLRQHPEACAEYAQLKENLLKDETSFEKNNSLFAGYTLGKEAFIRHILKQAGFHRNRFVKCTHDAEWEAARRLRNENFFDKVPLADPYTWTFNHPNHGHFIFYDGVDIVGYAHIQLWPHSRAALRIIVIDEPHRHRGFGRHFLSLIEKWLKHQGYQSLHTESSPEALPFYQKQGYVGMPFEDPDNHESDPRDTPLGKGL